MSEMKLVGRESISAYISQDGLICLQQEDIHDGPKIVEMLPSDIPKVIEWLQQLESEFPLDEQD